ncbi:unnamed protein product, partial [Laminaria digitata]
QTTRSALSRLRMGNYEKITVEFKEAFWPTDAPFIGCCPAASHAGDDIPSSPLPATATAATATAPNGSRPLPPAAFSMETPCAAPSAPPVKSSPLPTASNGSPHATTTTTTTTTTTKVVPRPSGERHEAVPAVVTPAIPVEAVAAAAAANPAIVSPTPIFLENYLWSKGVPVLTMAVTGERARAISAAAAVASAAAAAAGRVGKKKGGDAWREAHVREVYCRLVKPALADAFAKKGKKLPEPVSVVLSRCVFL